MDVPLYEIKDGKLKPIREEDFKLEKDLQNYVMIILRHCLV